MEKQKVAIRQLAEGRIELQESMEQLKNYLENRKRDKNREISAYNWLLCYNDKEIMESVMRSMIDIIRDYGNCCIVSEEELFERSMEYFERFSAVFIEVDDATTLERWENKLEMMQEKPELIKVLCASETVTDCVLKQNEHLYYRVFAKHLKIRAIEVNDIAFLFYQKLAKNRFKTTPEFDEAIDAYLKTVYPKAQLKGMDFVDDLYRRVHAQYLQMAPSLHGAIEYVLDEQFVPFYHKTGVPEETPIHKVELSKKMEVAPNREFGKSLQEEENVLLLALSTIAKEPSMCLYSNNIPNKNAQENEDEFYCTGISQLEPGTKQVLYQLAKEGKKLDRIVIVESSATRTLEVKDIADTFWDDPDYMRDKCRSAVCFYKQRILDYIHRTYKDKILSDEKGMFPNAKELECVFPENISYDETELQYLFYDVPTNDIPDTNTTGFQVYVEESLELFMEIIRGIKGNAEKKINLYIDTQGGSRSAIQQINAVVELLKDQKVEIRGRYAIPKFNKTGMNLIKEVGKSYKSYELVSAMTEFKLYGRGQGLTNFFQNVNAEGDVTKAVVDVVNKMSDAISLCNMKLFESALNELHGLKLEIEQNPDSVGSQMKIVFEDIAGNYADLLKGNCSPFDIVKWCTERYYYQQAITIIESKMPGMLVKCGIFDYNSKHKLKKVYSEHYKGDNNNINAVIKALHVRKDRKLVENYLFEQWIYSNSSGEKNNKSWFGEKLQLNGTLRNHWKGIASRFQSCQCLKIYRKKSESDDAYDYLYTYEQFDQKVRTMKPCELKSMILMFSALSAALKEARNNINHAKSDLTVEQIKDALDVYILLGEKMELSEKWSKIQKTKDNSK